MINILIGVGICLFFFITHFSAGYIGYRLAHRTKAERLTEEELRRIKAMEDGFKNVMNYDYSKALERR